MDPLISYCKKVTAFRETHHMNKSGWSKEGEGLGMGCDYEFADV